MLDVTHLLTAARMPQLEAPVSVTSEEIMQYLQQHSKSLACELVKQMVPKHISQACCATAPAEAMLGWSTTNCTAPEGHGAAVVGIGSSLKALSLCILQQQRPAAPDLYRTVEGCFVAQVSKLPTTGTQCQGQECLVQDLRALYSSAGRTSPQQQGGQLREQALQVNSTVRAARSHRNGELQHARGGMLEGQVLEQAAGGLAVGCIDDCHVQQKGTSAHDATWLGRKEDVMSMVPTNSCTDTSCTYDYNHTVQVDFSECQELLAAMAALLE